MYPQTIFLAVVQALALALPQFQADPKALIPSGDLVLQKISHIAVPIEERIAPQAYSNVQPNSWPGQRGASQIQNPNNLVNNHVLRKESNVVEPIQGEQLRRYSNIQRWSSQPFGSKVQNPNKPMGDLVLSKQSSVVEPIQQAQPQTYSNIRPSSWSSQPFGSQVQNPNNPMGDLVLREQSSVVEPIQQAQPETYSNIQQSPWNSQPVAPQVQNPNNPMGDLVLSKQSDIVEPIQQAQPQTYSNIQQSPWNSQPVAPQVQNPNNPMGDLVLSKQSNIVEPIKQAEPPAYSNNRYNSWSAQPGASQLQNPNQPMVDLEFSKSNVVEPVQPARVYQPPPYQWRDAYGYPRGDIVEPKVEQQYTPNGASRTGPMKQSYPPRMTMDKNRIQPNAQPGYDVVNKKKVGGSYADLPTKIEYDVRPNRNNEPQSNSLGGTYYRGQFGGVYPDSNMAYQRRMLDNNNDLEEGNPQKQK